MSFIIVRLDDAQSFACINLVFECKLNRKIAACRKRFVINIFRHCFNSVWDSKRYNYTRAINYNNNINKRSKNNNNNSRSTKNNNNNSSTSITASFLSVLLHHYQPFFLTFCCNSRVPGKGGGLCSYHLDFFKGLPVVRRNIFLPSIGLPLSYFPIQQHSSRSLTYSPPPPFQ